MIETTLDSPNSLLYEAILCRMKEQVPEIRFTDQDLGQLEAYEIRPAVSFPCCLIELEQFQFSEANNFKIQIAEGVVSFRLGLVKYTDSNNLTPKNTRVNALQYYEIEQKVYKAFHGWAPPGFSKFLRRVAGTEKREDDIRVRAIRFATSYTDTSAVDETIKVPRPNAKINTNGDN